MTQLYFNPSSGTLFAGVFNSLSDGGLKENVGVIDGYNLINKIHPVSFNWKNTGKKSYGVIAQELESFIPELVETNEEGIKSVSYTPMIAILIDVILKQQKEIEDIKKYMNNKEA